MKLLRINGPKGEFRLGDASYRELDKLTKEDLLALVNWTLHEDVAEFDEYDETVIKNQAHQIIYKSVLNKLRELRGRREQFIDEAARLYLEDYEKYKEPARSAD